MKAASRRFWLMMSLSSAYERSTCPSFCRNTYRVDLRSGISVLRGTQRCWRLYALSRVHRTDMTPQQPLPYLLSARIYLTATFLLMRELPIKMTVKLGLQKEACISQHIVSYCPINELMLLSDVYMYVLCSS